MTVYSSEQLLSRIQLKPGDRFDIVEMKQGLEQIKQLYDEKGYVNFSYIPQQEFNEKSKTVTLLFNIEESIPYYIDRVTFTGSIREHDSALRNAMRFEEGQPFRPKDLEATVAAINKLRFFEEIVPADLKVELQQDPFIKNRGLARITFNLSLAHQPK